jgi:uncharacterized FlaG/YvyC family protein
MKEFDQAWVDLSNTYQNLSIRLKFIKKAKAENNSNKELEKIVEQMNKLIKLMDKSCNTIDETYERGCIIINSNEKQKNVNEVLQN